MCCLYILEVSNAIVHSLSTSEDFHYKNKLWDLRSMHDDHLEVSLELFNEFYKRQWIKTHEIVELSFNLQGKVDDKVAYLIGRELCMGRRVKTKVYKAFRNYGGKNLV